MRRLLGYLDKAIQLSSSWSKWVAIAGVILIVLVTTVDVTGRYAFNKPVQGSTEINSLLMVLIVMLGLAYTQAQHRHLEVTFLVQKLPRQAQAIIFALAAILTLGIVAVILWRSAIYSAVYFQQGTTTAFIKIPVFLFCVLTPIGFFLWALALIADKVKSLKKMLSSEVVKVG